MQRCFENDGCDCFRLHQNQRRFVAFVSSYLNFWSFVVDWMNSTNQNRPGQQVFLFIQAYRELSELLVYILSWISFIFVSGSNCSVRFGSTKLCFAIWTDSKFFAWSCHGCRYGYSSNAWHRRQHPNIFYTIKRDISHKTCCQYELPAQSQDIDCPKF
jgi:hypothetical protein